MANYRPTGITRTLSLDAPPNYFVRIVLVAPCVTVSIVSSITTEPEPILMSFFIYSTVTYYDIITVALCVLPCYIICMRTFLLYLLADVLVMEILLFIFTIRCLRASSKLLIHEGRNTSYLSTTTRERYYDNNNK